MILRVLFLLFWEVYEKFSLKRTYICDLIYFGMFILALLTYIDNRNKHK